MSNSVIYRYRDSRGKVMTTNQIPLLHLANLARQAGANALADRLMRELLDPWPRPSLLWGLRVAAGYMP